MSSLTRSEVHFPLQFSDPEPFDLWVKSNKEVLTTAPEAQVAATLLPAMYKGEDLMVEEPLDPKFVDNLSTIQDIYSTWYSEANRIAIHAPKSDPKAPSSSTGCTAAFFTGGIDSFYTFLKHQNEVDALVYVHGLDVALDDNLLRTEVSSMIHEVGEYFDKKVIEVETNIRKFQNGVVHWGEYFGAALACVAHVLRQKISSIYIATAQTYQNLFPNGAHPLLDPLWGGERLEIMHDGCEANRVDKSAKIAESTIALSNLRVCWKNPDGDYNCGQCEKCQRTMINLLAVGALENCNAFDSGLDLHKIAQLPLHRKPKAATLMRQNLKALEYKDRAPDVQEAIRHALRDPSLMKRTAKALSDTYLSGRRRVGNVLRHLNLRQ